MGPPTHGGQYKGGDIPESADVGFIDQRKAAARARLANTGKERHVSKAAPRDSGPVSRGTAASRMVASTGTNPRRESRVAEGESSSTNAPVGVGEQSRLALAALNSSRRYFTALEEARTAQFKGDEALKRDVEAGKEVARRDAKAAGAAVSVPRDARVFPAELLDDVDTVSVVSSRARR